MEATFATMCLQMDGSAYSLQVHTAVEDMVCSLIWERVMHVNSHFCPFNLEFIVTHVHGNPLASLTDG